MKQKETGLDISASYEEALNLLRNIKYLLHIQDRQDEAQAIGEAIERLDQAYNSSKQ